MNDLYYIKYNPELMLCDTMDMTAATELAHRRLSDFIWRQSKAYKNNVPLLIHFTKCQADQWPEVWAGLQEKGWKISGDYVIHQGVIESHNAAQIEYAKQCDQTAAASAAKTGKNPVFAQIVTDTATGIVTVIVTRNVTTVVTRNVTTVVTNNATKPVTNPQSKSKPKPERTTGITSQTSHSEPLAHGTRLNFSALSRMATDIKENRHSWHYDNHKLSPDDLVTAGLVGALRPFVDRLTEQQVRECWAEAALRTHQAAVDGMNITHSLSHYAIGIWRDLMEKIATPISD
mgnify:CR=1 FL=1